MLNANARWSESLRERDYVTQAITTQLGARNQASKVKNNYNLNTSNQNKDYLKPWIWMNEHIKSPQGDIC